MIQESPFWKHISLSVEAASKGQSEVRIEVQEHLLNYAGTVQGGVLATLIDVTTGSAVSSLLNDTQKIVTTDLTTQYVLPAEGPFIIGKGHVKHFGRSFAVSYAEILNEEGTIVALGSASFRILQR